MIELIKKLGNKIGIRQCLTGCCFCRMLQNGTFYCCRCGKWEQRNESRTKNN